MKKYLSIAITLAFLLSAMAFPMQVNAATTIKSGKTVSDSVALATREEFQINSDSSGKMTVTISPTDIVQIQVFEKGGKEIAPSKATNASSTFGGGYSTKSNTEQSTLVYNVKKSTYIIMVSNQYGYGSVSSIAFDLTVTVPTAKEESGDTSKTDSTVIGAELKKGSSVQLVGPSSNATWKSSKASVAKVSSSGKVTAVAKGSATITATSGKTVLKIKIIVP